MKKSKIQTDSEETKKQLLELSTIAIDKLRQLRGPVVQICGPISTGGFGNVEDNIRCISTVINACTENGISVFDQIKYEPTLDKILGLSTENDHYILDYFYKPILSSNIISALIFLPLWSTSTGSRWERDFALNNRIDVFDLENITIEELKSIKNRLLNK